MKRKLYLYTICLLSLFTSCKEAKEQNHKESDTSETSHDHEASGDIIILAQEKAKLAGVYAEKIKKSSFQNIIKVGGKLVPTNSKEVSIVAKTNGVIIVPDHLLPGKYVQKNQNLFAISSRNIQDGDPTLKAKIEYDISKSEYERVLPLVEEGIVTQKDFSAIKRTYETAKVAYEALAKEYTTNGLLIKSETQGYIKELSIKNGEYVTIGQQIAVITDNNKLLLQAEVPNRYFSELKNITTANFKTTNLSKTYKLSDLNGKVVSYAKEIPSNSTLLPITFSFNNLNQQFIPGSFAEVYLLSSKIENVISLPYTAITEEENLYFVYKQICKEEYEKVEVTLGLDNGEQVEIKSGVAENDLIVTKGAQQIKLASSTNAIPAHTHEH